MELEKKIMEYFVKVENLQVSTKGKAEILEKEEAIKKMEELKQDKEHLHKLDELICLDRSIKDYMKQLSFILPLEKEDYIIDGNQEMNHRLLMVYLSNKNKLCNEFKHVDYNELKEIICFKHITGIHLKGDLIDTFIFSSSILDDNKPLDLFNLKALSD